jgi:putrescine transport system ATP-binding protein
LNALPEAERLAARRALAPWADPKARPLIRFEGVTKRFGDTLAVDSLSLDIFEREFFCLLGPSGCGKSTLMRLLAGFEEPTAGRVLLMGEDLSGVPPHRRPVNMMFQSYALFPHMSVAGNIAFGLRQERRPRREIEARVEAMLELVQLQGLGDRRPEHLSGGQRQRVALARALAKEPKVLLLDEPLAALDKKLREETQFELMEIQERLGATFLMVTHDQDEAMTMADRIAVMDRGRIVQLATPAELYERPKTRFVAEFVGDINIFEGEVLDGDEGLLRVKIADAEAIAVADSGVGLAIGQAVAVAVRPEKIAIDREPPPSAVNMLAGEVSDIGYLGDWTTYRVKLASGTIVRVSRANATRLAENPIEWGDRVRLSFAPDAAIILGPER